MNHSLPLREETIVSSVDGNAATSDAEFPVLIRPYAAGGAVLYPSPTATTPDKVLLVQTGKVHFSLESLRSPWNQPRDRSVPDRLMVTSSLKVSVAPHNGESADEAGNDLVIDTTLRRPTKIVAVDLYTGRERLGSWQGKPGQPQQGLPADDDFELHIHSDFFGERDAQRLNGRDEIKVILTIQFIGQQPAIIVLSVAVVQTLRFTGGFGRGGF